MSTCTATWVLLVKLNAPLLSGNVPEGVITVALKPDWNPVPVTVSVVGTFEVTVLGKIELMDTAPPAEVIVTGPERSRSLDESCPAKTLSASTITQT